MKQISDRIASRKMAVYLPFFIVCVVSFIYHARMQPMGGDDVFFSQATADKTMWEYLSDRYLTWTSRIVSEFVLVSVIQVPVVWRILDFFAFATLPILISKIAGGGELMNWCACAAVLLYPFHDMGTAGWITTTVTHFWPVWCIFFVGMLLRKMLDGEKISLPEAAVGILAAILTGSHEQYAVILIVVCGLYLFYLRIYRRKIKNMPLLVMFVMIEIISLAVIFLCPGNAGRNEVSIADLPIYAEFGFGEKLYLGLLSIERVFIANCDAVFFAVILIWTVLVYLKTDDFKKTLFAGLPLLILFGQTVVRTAYPGLSGLFVIPGEVLAWSWGELSTWIPMVYLAISVISMIYALYVMLGEDMFLYICALLMAGCGFGAGMVIGFMATIYVSGERVYAPLYFILILITIICIRTMGDKVWEKVRQTGGKLVLTVLAILCLVNIGFITLSV